MSASGAAPVSSTPFLPFPAITDRPARLGVLISGGGTTLLNFVKRIQQRRLNASIVRVIASQRSCRGVERAQQAALDCQVLRPRDFASVRLFSEAVFGALRDAQADLVVLAGFLSLLEIPDDFLWRVVNIHPSLIPAFCGHGYYGHHVHEAAIARGVKVSGCTVHFADNEYDHGPVISQRVVRIPDGCTADQLAGLVFRQESIAYPAAVQDLITGRIQVIGRRTVRLP